MPMNCHPSRCANFVQQTSGLIVCVECHMDGHMDGWMRVADAW